MFVRSFVTNQNSSCWVCCTSIRALDAPMELFHWDCCFLKGKKKKEIKEQNVQQKQKQKTLSLFYLSRSDNRPFAKRKNLCNRHRILHRGRYLRLRISQNWLQTWFWDKRKALPSLFRTDLIILLVESNHGVPRCDLKWISCRWFEERISWKPFWMRHWLLVMFLETCRMCAANQESNYVQRLVFSKSWLSRWLFESLELFSVHPKKCSIW